jgi:hypothetical protein
MQKPWISKTRRKVSPLQENRYNNKTHPSVSLAGLSMNLQRRDPFSPLTCSSPGCTKTFISRKEAAKHVKGVHFGDALLSSSSRPVTLYPEEDDDDPAAAAASSIPLGYEDEPVAVSVPPAPFDGNEVPPQVPRQARLPEDSDDDEEVVLSIFTTRPRLGRAAPPSPPLNAPAPIVTAVPAIPTAAAPVATVVRQRCIPTPPINAAAPVIQQQRVTTPPAPIAVPARPNVDALQALEAIKVALRCPM